MDAGVNPLGSELAGGSKDSGGRLRICAELKSNGESNCPDVHSEASSEFPTSCVRQVFPGNQPAMTVCSMAVLSSNIARGVTYQSRNMTAAPCVSNAVVNGSRGRLIRMDVSSTTHAGARRGPRAVGHTHFGAGASWVEEYGDPDKPEDWAFLQGFSPYHNLRDGVVTPPVLFLTSTRDDRVHPGHARKMAAKMIAAGADVLYYENIEGGHGAAANNEQRAYKWALIFEFLWRTLDRPRPARDVAATGG